MNLSKRINGNVPIAIGTSQPPSAVEFTRNRVGLSGQKRQQRKKEDTAIVVVVLAIIHRIVMRLDTSRAMRLIRAASNDQLDSISRPFK